jgi:hypothetical protein
MGRSLPIAALGLWLLGCGSSGMQVGTPTTPDASDAGPDAPPGFAVADTAVQEDSLDPSMVTILDKPYDASPRPLPPGVDATRYVAPDLAPEQPADADVADAPPPLPQACAALGHCCERLYQIPELKIGCESQAMNGDEVQCSTTFRAPWQAARDCYEEFTMRRDQ